MEFVFTCAVNTIIRANYYRQPLCCRLKRNAVTSAQIALCLTKLYIYFIHLLFESCYICFVLIWFIFLCFVFVIASWLGSCVL